jgi:hypothetical protein
LLKCTSLPPPFYKKEGYIEHILGKHIGINPDESFLFFITKGMEIYGTAGVLKFFIIGGT